MIRIGVVGCGLQAATIASYVGVYNDEYEVVAVADVNLENAKSRLAEKKVCVSESCRFFNNVDEFIAAAPEVDGIIIGTFCTYHTETACKLEKLGVPLYIEKPVAINLEQLMQLYNTFKNSRTPIEVSLPMRMCALTQKAKALIDSGAIGPVHQAVGYEDTPGEIYFSTWFRDFEKTGGMFLQKAVHDIDYLFYLTGSIPTEVCAMRAKTYYQGDKPYDMTCRECPDQATCPEGPVAQFREMGRYNSVAEAVNACSLRMNPDGKVGTKRLCVFSKDIAIEDIGECIFRMESGAHVTHTQNFIARGHACRRGARFCGSNGTLEIDFNNGTLAVSSHRNSSQEKYQVDPGKLSHYGGDKELIYDFIQCMKTGKRARTDLITGNGVMSTLACICARESADSAKFVKIKLD
ncbi:MAG: Gfo/Idh/MocA family oxidoreductase [Lentisphaeria bacterium]|nr:Gfo/Idh/MocA family oxidoreductase [Lentisphaeria bacterium]